MPVESLILRAFPHFKRHKPVCEIRLIKPVNKFKLNVSNVLGVNEDVSVFEGKKKEINLSQYVNLYLPPSNNAEFDILKQEIKPQVLFLNTQNAITRTSVNNGQ